MCKSLIKCRSQVDDLALHLAFNSEMELISRRLTIILPFAFFVVSLVKDKKYVICRDLLTIN